MTQERMSGDLSKVTRFEVIDQNGRQYVNANISGLELSYQDDGRTLKIFVRDETGRRVLPQDKLTAEEIGRLRRSSDDAIAYFRAQLADERVRSVEPRREVKEPPEVLKEQAEAFLRMQEEQRAEAFLRFLRNG